MALTITQISRHVYSVESPPNEKNTVDVMAFDWNGSCTCETFCGCCRFLLRHQNRIERQRCPHILSVREWIMENEYPSLAERAEKIIELPTHENRLSTAGI